MIMQKADMVQILFAENWKIRKSLHLLGGTEKKAGAIASQKTVYKFFLMFLQWGCVFFLRVKAKILVLNLMSVFITEPNNKKPHMRFLLCKYIKFENLLVCFQSIQGFLIR